MNAPDPGLALKCTTLDLAAALLPWPREPSPEGERGPSPWEALPSEDAVEEFAMAAGYRSRRILLDREWWKQAGTPMLVRVADRRRAARGEAMPANPHLAGGNGWAAVLPEPGGGYRMRAFFPDGTTPIEWKVDAEVAERLSPFGFTFLPRLPSHALGARDILRHAFGQGRADLAFMLALGLAAALLGLLTPVATGTLIDHVIPAGDAARVGLVIAALGLAGLGLVGLEVLRSIAVMRFEARLGVTMQAALVDRVISAPVAFFRKFSSGDLALRMGAVNTVQRSMTGSAIGTVTTAIFAVASLLLMLAYSASLTAAAGGIVALGIAISVAIGLARLKVGPRVEALDGKLGAMTFELFAGIPKLRAAAAEPRAWARWRDLYHDFRSANGVAARIENAESLALSLLQPAATILVLYLAWRMPSASGFTTGDFVAFQTAMFGLLGAVQSLVGTAVNLVNLKPLWDRARPILETTPESARGAGERHEPKGAIALENLTFAYGDGPPVLQDVSLSIAPGEFVAIVGASGSGKSTLLRLLLGFEAPASGTIRYDGKDLAGLDAGYLRRRMGTVLQGGRLWAGDLLSNIAGASRSDVDQVWEAARSAGLAEDIERMPMGLYTLVGEGLSTLSGGQRQRVLIARALVGKPGILLLDEATSALDNLSQAKVLAGLASLQATRLVIAHRLNTIRDADRIVVLERGRVVQQGTFGELAARPGAFAALLARQVA